MRERRDKLKQENEWLRKKEKEFWNEEHKKLKQENEELKEERKLKVVAMADACVDTITEYKKSLILCQETFDEALNKLELSISIHDRLELRDKLAKALKSVNDILGKEKSNAK